VQILLPLLKFLLRVVFGVSYRLDLKLLELCLRELLLSLLLAYLLVRSGQLLYLLRVGVRQLLRLDSGFQRLVQIVLGNKDFRFYLFAQFALHVLFELRNYLLRLSFLRFRLLQNRLRVRFVRLLSFRSFLS
jgi:hypothetical protein